MKKITMVCFLLFYSLGFCQVLVTDAAFSGVTSGIPDGNLAYETVVRPDGKILLGGEIVQYNGQPFSGIVRLNSDGSIDNSFISGNGFGFGSSIARITQIYLSPDGKMLVAGMFTSYNGTPCSGIVRLSADGVLDTTFTSPVFNYTDTSIPNCIYDIAVTTDGKIYLGGDFKLLSNGARSLIRLNSNGTLDGSFDTVYFSSEHPSVLSLCLLDSGKIIAGGYFNFSDSSEGIAQFTANGSLDPDFYNNLSVSGVVYHLFAQPDGKILYGGFLIKNGSYYLLDRLNSDGTSDGIFTPMVAFESDTGVNRVSSIHNYMGKTLVSGWGMPGIESGTLSQLLLLNDDGSPDAGFNTGAGFYFPLYNAGVLSLAIQPDNKIITAGFFDSYNDEPLNNITRLTEQTADIASVVKPDEGVVVYNKDGVFSVVSFDVNIRSIEIFDINGRLLVSRSNVFSKECNVLNMACNQVLISKIELVSGVVVNIKSTN